MLQASEHLRIMVPLLFLQMMRPVVEEVDPVLLPPQIDRGQQFPVLAEHRDLTAEPGCEVPHHQPVKGLRRRFSPHIREAEHSSCGLRRQSRRHQRSRTSHCHGAPGLMEMVTDLY
ncbi:hypothetical protein CVA01_25790 [Corynebacterium variabile]|uniref:Uncharacterized protein n=1 Tax=Corynebacterium variabile TaxID=1727 RepID=A0A4Y4C2L5_9CORY|nr:hypothetical protein CVA01_25790 [Corynebacterium variabile]